MFIPSFVTRQLVFMTICDPVRAVGHAQTDFRIHEKEFCPFGIAKTDYMTAIYEGRLKSSWTHLITQSRNFVEVRWRSLFRSTSLGKWCTSYNAQNCLPRSSLFMVGKARKWHGARSGLYGGCSNGVPLIHFFQAEHRIQFRSRPIRFLSFSNLEKGTPRQEISKWSTVCSTFTRSGWSVVRSASLAKGGTSKKRPSPHLHKVPTRSNKVSSRTLQTALVIQAHKNENV
jgi:hypothetical protein